MKKFFIFFILVLFCAGTGQGLYWIRKGFSLRRVQPTFSSNAFRINRPMLLQDPANSITSIFFEDSETEKALSQPFHFLSRGRQCFAFLSEDGQYVLKLPRTDIYALPLWTRALPVSSYRNHLQNIKTHRKQFVNHSFRLAYQDLKEETGMIAIHMDIDEMIDRQNQSLTIFDPLGCPFHLPLNQTCFLLQRRYSLLMDHFLQSLRQGKRTEAEDILRAFVDVVIQRAKKGIFFRDRSFLRNFGFDGKKGYLIDVGDFYKREDIQEQIAFFESIEGTMHPLRIWLQKVDPPSLSFLEKTLAMVYQARPETLNFERAKTR